MAVPRRPAWQTAVAKFGLGIAGAVVERSDEEALPFEIGIVGLSGVGKSSLLNALVAPARELLPSGGIGPLTGVPVRICHASAATLRVKYLGRAWLLDALEALASSSGGATPELGRFSLACAGNQYATRDPEWLQRAMRYALQPEISKPPDERPETRDALARVHEILARDGAACEWQSDAPDGAFFRRVHEHVAGPTAALCERIELGWPSAMLESGVVLVDLPGLGTVSDGYAQHTRMWVEQASAIVVVADRAGLTESVVTCLRRNGFLRRVADGQADLMGVVTKLDQVTDDLRRADRSTGPWSRCFRSIVERAEAELLGQIATLLRDELGCPLGDGAAPQDAIAVFGVSSREYRRVVDRDDEDRPRLHLAESSGVPAVRRAMTALGRLRSSPWTSEILDRVRSSPDFAARLPELISLVDTEGL